MMDTLERWSNFIFSFYKKKWVRTSQFTLEDTTRIFEFDPELQKNVQIILKKINKNNFKINFNLKNSFAYHEIISSNSRIVNIIIPHNQIFLKVSFFINKDSIKSFFSILEDGNIIGLYSEKHMDYYKLAFLIMENSFSIFSKTPKLKLKTLSSIYNFKCDEFLTLYIRNHSENLV